MELQQLDRESRKILKENGGYHPMGKTDLLYLPRKFGGRGLKSVESTYKNRELKMRRRNEMTTTTGSWICTDACAAHVSVCDFVVHGSSTTKFVRESGSRENVSTFFP